MNPRQAQCFPRLTSSQNTIAYFFLPVNNNKCICMCINISRANRSRIVENCFDPVDEPAIAGKCFKMIITNSTAAVSLRNTWRGGFPWDVEHDLRACNSLYVFKSPINRNNCGEIVRVFFKNTTHVPLTSHRCCTMRGLRLSSIDSVGEHDVARRGEAS